MILQRAGREQIVFWLVFFTTLIAGLAIQKLVLPVFLPHLHVGHGLLKGGDSIGFHFMASELADQIRINGWQAWSLRPNGHAPAGIAAATYAITGVSEPWILIPINAALFALGAASIFRIGILLTGNNSAAFAAVVPFAIFPSAAVIYADLHKDIWACAGSLLIISVWARLEAAEVLRISDAIRFAVLCLAGALLVWVVRPYFVKVLLFVSIFVLIVRVLAEVIWRRWRPGTFGWKKLAAFVFCLVMLAVVMNMPTQASEFSDQPTVAKTIEWVAVNTSGSIIDDSLARIALAREGFFLTYPDAKSFIDRDVTFRSVGELVRYIPRALQIGLFAPFPPMWFAENVSAAARIMRTISGFEMAISYVLLIGVLLLIPLTSGRRLFVAMIAITSCALILIIMAMGIPNVGTLNRMRYGFLMLPVGLGAAGWTLFIDRWRAYKA